MKQPPAQPIVASQVLAQCANCRTDITDQEAVWRVGSDCYCTTRTCHERYQAEGRGFYDILGLEFPDKLEGF